MPQVPNKMVGRIIIVTVQQTCHSDMTKGDFSSAGSRQVRINRLKRMTDTCWIIRELKKKKFQVCRCSQLTILESINICNL